MSFATRYHERLQALGFAPDPHQLPVVEALAQLQVQLEKKPPGSGWRGFFSSRAPVRVRGLYLWGGVGRGKTWLMDLFFDALSEPRKQRLHFHRFMQQVHDEMATIKRQADPLRLVARRMAKHWRLLCLDEFNVVDIGDAVILARLLEALFDEGVILVTTSNVSPEDLYRDGIQRASFLPAISLLQQRLQVLAMGGERDYRVEILSGNRLFHWPLSAEVDAQLATEFERMAGGEAIARDGELLINNRVMPYRAALDGMVWFDFEALCGPPRSQHDYIELARCQHTVFLSGVPVMGASRDDRTRRFIFLIDEFYDRRVKLVMSANAPVSRLYMGERLAFEFQRTVSRLTEMQTPAYLGQQHRS